MFVLRNGVPNTRVVHYWFKTSGMYGYDGLHAWSAVQPDTHEGGSFLERMYKIESARGLAHA